MLAQPEGSRWYALFPVHARSRPATGCAISLFDLRKKGFNRLFQAARVFEFSTPESLLDIDFTQAGVRAGGSSRHSGCMRQRLVDTVEICYREAGEVIFEAASRRRGTAPLQRKVRSARPAARNSSSLSPACSASTILSARARRCQGFGNTIDYDMDLVIPDSRYRSTRARSIPGPSRSTPES